MKKKLNYYDCLYHPGTWNRRCRIISKALKHKYLIKFSDGAIAEVPKWSIKKARYKYVENLRHN